MKTTQRPGAQHHDEDREGPGDDQRGDVLLLRCPHAVIIPRRRSATSSSRSTFARARRSHRSRPAPGVEQRRLGQQVTQHGRAAGREVGVGDVGVLRAAPLARTTRSGPASAARIARSASQSTCPAWSPSAGRCVPVSRTSRATSAATARPGAWSRRAVRTAPRRRPVRRTPRRGTRRRAAPPSRAGSSAAIRVVDVLRAPRSGAAGRGTRGRRRRTPPPAGRAGLSSPAGQYVVRSSVRLIGDPPADAAGARQFIPKLFTARLHRVTVCQ